MKFAITIIIVQAVAIVCLVAFGVEWRNDPRSVYVINEKIFNSYRGKTALERKLDVIRKKHETQLDSLRSVYVAGNAGNYPAIREALRREQAWKEEALVNEYTMALWKEINGHIKAYGADHHLSFIHGATGDGALMYAADALDVTEDVIRYLNEKYESK